MRKSVSYKTMKLPVSRINEKRTNSFASEVIEQASKEDLISCVFKTRFKPIVQPPVTVEEVVKVPGRLTMKSRSSKSKRFSKLPSRLNRAISMKL